MAAELGALAAGGDPEAAAALERGDMRRDPKPGNAAPMVRALSLRVGGIVLLADLLRAHPAAVRAWAAGQGRPTPEERERLEALAVEFAPDPAGFALALEALRAVWGA